jgi:hypothetical protein
MPHGMMRREFALAAGAGAFGSSRCGLAGTGRRGLDPLFYRLRVLEAIWATAYVRRNRGYMGFDTLFVLDPP